MTTQRILKVGLAVVFALLLTVPTLIKRFGDPSADAGEALSASASADGAGA